MAGRASGRRNRKLAASIDASALRSALLPRLFYAEVGDGFECDWLIATSAAGARAELRGMYGADAPIDFVVQVMVLEAGHEPGWLGPDAPVLAELGGVDCSINGFPRYRFGSRVYGRSEANCKDPYGVPNNNPEARIASARSARR